MRRKLFSIFLFVFLATVIFAQTEAEAAVIVSSMDDDTLAAQVLLSGIDGRLALTPDMRTILKKVPAGGIMLFRYNLDSSKDEVRELLSEVSSLVSDSGGIPPFIAVDHEGGLVHRFGPGVERLPAAFSFWELAQKEGRNAALARAELLYRLSALEIKGLGITMVLGPVAEILNNDNRAFLDTRSYGPDPDFVGAAASVFIKMMDAAGIASVVKHFPGNTGADPHSKVSSLKAGRPELSEMVKPFTGLFYEDEPAAVMVSHVMVPALDDQKIASLSRAVIQGWLRGELGFKGIVLADDFSMGAATGTGQNLSEAAVEALNAGVDMIMVWPGNIRQVHASILKALKDGRLPRVRLMEAAGKIIAGKLRYGIVDLSK